MSWTLTPSDFAYNLGVIFDSSLTISDHISSVSKSYFLSKHSYLASLPIFAQSSPYPFRHLHLFFHTTVTLKRLTISPRPKITDRSFTRRAPVPCNALPKNVANLSPTNSRRSIRLYSSASWSIHILISLHAQNLIHQSFPPQCFSCICSPYGSFDLASGLPSLQALKL
jgi:hypothetical protein